MRIEALKLTPVNSSMVEKVTPQIEEGKKNFGEFLTEALGEVNSLQQNAAKASFDLAAGNLQDISQVTIAAEKATIAMQLTMQVRNKVVDAYQEIMRMQV
ncbi:MULTISPECIES: flagellar hook-basal body complex protein FliE [Pelosinus]|uniref:Flagellar hook-basal body complex protein FliE n=1 Tax=Pelosinus fermentans B4 TaxID=1149862 RepID=I8RFD2_9FIRM|nr:MULTISPECIES: flagellar hook-basal body complex protein FliE [Pelosinus]EIW18218.1 flagellar hook-basal body complex subunit FliE [Pelosinus fermentans B4]EIW24022.1 Flagellar hook-basal body complex protein fliE [Pelosinus fermentans A11]OAM94050.1 Flagellar hook-basal body complex protein fliE [Pelosinus fermentans DSM 17108]SDQ98330.1 flagellar hook-basal body complex protein FliE [Pelosinus fermentans]